MRGGPATDIFCGKNVPTYYWKLFLGLQQIYKRIEDISLYIDKKIS